MKKLLLISALSLIVTACGGENKTQDAVNDTAKNASENVAKIAENTTNNVTNNATEKVLDATSASTETVTKVTDSIKKAVDPEINALKNTHLKTEVEKAKKITKAFGGALKSELKKAIKEGGLINAMNVCNTQALPITLLAGIEHDVTLSRVSLKNRSPINVPNDWQKVVLKDFDSRFAKGESVKKMAFAKIVENDGKKQFRFMKALPTGDKCLACHGAEINSEVSARLAKLYPDDKATGYLKGQVRGAIVIVKDLE